MESSNACYIRRSYQSEGLQFSDAHHPLFSITIFFTAESPIILLLQLT